MSKQDYKHFREYVEDCCRSKPMYQRHLYRQPQNHFAQIYKFIVAQNHQKADCVATGRLCSLFCEAGCSDDVYIQLKYFTDDKLFY